MNTASITIPTPKHLEQFTEAELTPYYTCKSDGVYYHGVTTDRNGDKHESAPIRLSDSIQLIGRGIDSAGNHYRIIQWTDRLNRQRQTAALSMEDIGNNWGKLQRLGITIHAGRRKRELLADYLQSEGDHTRYTITDRAGWHDNAYILPNGDILTHASNPEPIHYNGDKSQASAYQAQGTLEDWKQHITRYASGNSRLSLAIGCALAAPLMRLLDIEGGGIHLYGDSSDGKTTAAKVALSVWGNPDTLKLTWEGTGLGFSNIAAARNDNLLILDEIGQASPRVVSQTAYAVINGTSKIQGAREGGNREIKQWRILVFSTGEKTLQNYSQTGGADWQAGQANRLPSLPANAGKGYGIYDTLHDQTDGASLSEHLAATAQQQHGTAGRAFIAEILKDQPAAIKQAQTIMDSFCASLPPLTGQARRVGKRFALIAAALELAKQWGIIDNSAPSLAIKQCFDDWHAINGSGKYEDKRILEHAIDWLQQYADSPRFTYWRGSTTDKQHAGYFRYTTDDLRQLFPLDEPPPLEDIQEYWIIPAVFKAEICQSYEPSKVCAVLIDADWLQTETSKDGKTRHQKKRYGYGRFYVLKGMTPPEKEPTDDPPPQSKPS